MSYNPDRYHRQSIRLKSYDYSQTGAYFVTIVTRDRECLFGEIVEGEMRLNDAGRAVEHEWLNTPQIRIQVELDEYVVMPNHLHGILGIVDDRRGVLQYAPTDSHHTPTFRSPSQTVGAIVRGFKSAVTKRINAFRSAPGLPVWQRNYYEHIVRSAEELHRIRQYIVNNPLQWALDRENPAVAGVGAQHAAPLRDDIDDLLGGIRP